MPNLDPWLNQQIENDSSITIEEAEIEKEEKESSNFENYLLLLRFECQKMIKPNCHPTYNESHEKIIAMIDWTLDKYRSILNQQRRRGGGREEEKEKLILNNIINDLKRNREIAISNNKKSMLKDETASYRLDETTIDYILQMIYEYNSSNSYKLI